MRVAVFSARDYDEHYFNKLGGSHEWIYFRSHLRPQTARLAEGCEVACVFVNDRVDRDAVGKLAACGVRLLVLRSAGYNHVDLAAAAEAGITVARVPAYSPHAVAEHTIALILGLVRKLPRAHSRVRDGNFSLEGLLGFDLYKKTVGLIGLGRIGSIVAKILAGFDCTVLVYDPFARPDDTLSIAMTDLETLCSSADIISLHCPLTPHTHHVIDAKALELMKDGVMLINTSRGGLVDTRAVINGLKSGRIGHLGLDVYEEEGDLFFDDLSNKIIDDDVFARLLTFPNVLITGHQAFFTHEALSAIAATTLANIDAFSAGQRSGNEITLEAVRGQ